MRTNNNGFDLSTLDLYNIALADIPEFTVEDFAELKELQAKVIGDKNTTTTDEHKRIITLQFLKASDFHRDRATDDSFPQYDHIHTKLALQTFARAKLLEK